MEKKTEVQAAIDELRDTLADDTPSPPSGGEGGGEVVVFVADLDADGVYWGVLEKHRADLTETDFEVPPSCDLTPGKYKLNRDPARVGGPGFDPLPREKQKAAPQAPDLEEAVYALIKGDSAKVKAWAEHYEKTVLKD